MKNNLNRIGMGMYRMSIHGKNHLSVLSHAIGEGVNFIDTAPNYSIGDSEKLVGSLWDSHERKEEVRLRQATPSCLKVGKQEIGFLLC